MCFGLGAEDSFSYPPPKCLQPQVDITEPHSFVLFSKRQSSLRIARALSLLHLPHFVYISMFSDDKTHRRVVIVRACARSCACVNAGASMSQCT